MPTKKELLKSPIKHLDIKQHNVVPLVDAMQHMAYSARDTARAASIAIAVSDIADCSIINTFAHRDNTGTSVGENAVLVLNARNK